MAQLQLNDWIVGFVDGEGCFNLDTHIKDDMKWGLQMQPEFTVVQHECDKDILDAFGEKFECGKVRVNRKDATSTRMQWRCKGVADLQNKVVPFFTANPLVTKKQVEFERFRDIVALMHAGYHRKSLRNFLEVVQMGEDLRVRVSTPNPNKIDKRGGVNKQIELLRARLAADPSL